MKFFCCYGLPRDKCGHGTAISEWSSAVESMEELSTAGKREKMFS